MANIESIKVGIEMVDPNWKVMCMALTSHAMRALGYLEANRADLALEALREARAVGDMAFMCRCNILDASDSAITKATAQRD